MRWYGANQPVQIHSLLLSRPLTYVTDAKDPVEPSAISTRQKISLAGSDGLLGYWPSYAAMSPEQRGVYLQWMSGERQVMPAEIGYAFVFFYGLERRALKDQCEHSPIFEEVTRLRALHLDSSTKPSASFLSYTGSLLWLLIAHSPQQWEESWVKPLVESQRWQTDRVPVALNWCAAHYETLPGWLAFKMAGGMPTSVQSVACRNAPDEFRQLFQFRYHEAWPHGLPLRLAAPGRMIKSQVMHYAASSVLGSYAQTVEVSQKVLGSLNTLSGIWNSCVQELMPFVSLRSRSRQDDAEPSVTAAWEALPKPLRSGPHPASAQLSELVNPVIDRQKYAPLRVRALATLLALPARDKFTREQSLRLASAAEYCGYSIEPDARLTTKGYSAEEWAVFFRHEEEPTDVDRYRAAALILRLGIMAATAEGKADKAQLDLVARHILEVFDLSRPERRRLQALAGLLLATGVDTVAAKALLDALAPAQREAVARLLLAVVAHDGVISPAEMKSLKSAFERLGLGAAKLDEYLLKLRAEDGVTVVQRARRGERGEAIPAPITQSEPIQLNRAAIEQLLQDTREVQQALAEAIGGDEPESTLSRVEAGSEEMPAVATAPTNGSVDNISLDARFQVLYSELIKREAWPTVEATALARAQGQMLGAALEAINDWSLETHGAPLLYEEGATIVVELEILN